MFQTVVQGKHWCTDIWGRQPKRQTTQEKLNYLMPFLHRSSKATAPKQQCALAWSGKGRGRKQWWNCQLKDYSREAELTQIHRGKWNSLKSPEKELAYAIMNLSGSAVDLPATHWIIWHITCFSIYKVCNDYHTHLSGSLRINEPVLCFESTI